MEEKLVLLIFIIQTYTYEKSPYFTFSCFSCDSIFSN